MCPQFLAVDNAMELGVFRYGKQETTATKAESSRLVEASSKSAERMRVARVDH